MRELPPSLIGRPRVLKPPTVHRNDVPLTIDELEGGHISSQGEYSWVYKGSVLNAFSLIGEEPCLLGSLNFTKLLGDLSISITQVKELCDHLSATDPLWNPYNLVVVLNRPRSSHLGSIVCVVDVRLSKLIKAIETPFRVSSVTPVTVSSKGRALSSFNILAPELEPMNGVIALGAEGGLVVLVDLCFDQEIEVVLPPNKLTFAVKTSLACSSYDIREKRKISLIHGQNLGIQLNANSQNKTKYYYRENSGNILNTFESKNVYVSALEYIPMTNCLCVGFNFGGFQFWHLNTLLLDNSCALESSLQPVISFAFLEPENDPKNYCFMMMVRGSAIDDDPANEVKRFNDRAAPTVASLYLLCYDKKNWVPDYGVLYTEFNTSACRFEYNLTCFPHMPNIENCISSQLISCSTVRQGNPWAHRNSDEPCGEDEGFTDLTLCFISWEASSDTSESSSSFFAIFDLNQYYQAQMPSEFDSSTDALQWCPYMGVFSLNDVTNALSAEFTVDVKVEPSSVVKYRNHKFNHDLHYYPSSLSFNLTVLSDSAVINVRYLGIQRRLLKQIVDNGANSFIDPKELLKSCHQSGLLPDLSSQKEPMSVTAQREALLTLLLENDELSFIVDLINQLSTGKLNHVGCTTKFLSEWIWKRVGSIKATIDKISMPFFDYSREALDQFSLKVLHTSEADLRSLSVLICNLIEQSAADPTDASDHEKLVTRYETTQLVSVYLHVMLWLKHTGLLPEHKEGDQFGENEIAYPRNVLQKMYSERRQELKAINPQEIGETDMLVIDGFMEKLPQVSALWKKGGGNGQYPPPNVHALLGIYLIDSVSVDDKHKIMIYFLLDLADYFSQQNQSDVAEKVKLFPPTFSVNPTLVKYVQGVWAVDHQMFDFGIGLLLAPGVKRTFFQSEQNEGEGETAGKVQVRQRIVKSLLFQEKSAEAARFASSCPIDLSVHSLKTVDNLKTEMSILLANQKMMAAFRFQRNYQDSQNSEGLLLHFFTACEQMNLLKKVFSLPLNTTEQDALINYFCNFSSSAFAKPLVVIYFSMNKKTTEAVKFIEQHREELKACDKEQIKQLELLMTSEVVAPPPKQRSFAKLPITVAPTVHEEEMIHQPSVVRFAESVTSGPTESSDVEMSLPPSCLKQREAHAGDDSEVGSQQSMDLTGGGESDSQDVEMRPHTPPNPINNVYSPPMTRSRSKKKDNKNKTPRAPGPVTFDLSETPPQPTTRRASPRAESRNQPKK